MKFYSWVIFGLTIALLSLMALKCEARHVPFGRLAGVQNLIRVMSDEDESGEPQPLSIEEITSILDEFEEYGKI